MALSFSPRTALLILQVKIIAYFNAGYSTDFSVCNEQNLYVVCSIMVHIAMRTFFCPLSEIRIYLRILNFI